MRANKFTPTLYGVGYLGDGPYRRTIDRKKTVEYAYWSRMLERCYSTSANHATHYSDVFVCEEWHNFQNFAAWLNTQEFLHNKYQLDKDLLVPGSKIYGPSTSCLLPQQLNKLLTLRKADRGTQPLGVFHKSGRYTSQISIRGRISHLGSFDSPEAAFLAYRLAKLEYIKELVSTDYKDKISKEAQEALLSLDFFITD